MTTIKEDRGGLGITRATGNDWERLVTIGTVEEDWGRSIKDDWRQSGMIGTTGEDQRRSVDCERLKKNQERLGTTDRDGRLRMKRFRDDYG